MKASVFRASEDRPLAGVGRAGAAWAWLRRHRRWVMWGVVLVLGTKGAGELYDATRSWAAGDDAAVGRELKEVPMYFIAAWGVYRRPDVWGRRVGMLLVWVGAGVLVIGVPIVWWIWRTHPEAKGWWDGVSINAGDWLALVLRASGLFVFTAACLALRRIYAEVKSKPEASVVEDLG